MKDDPDLNTHFFGIIEVDPRIFLTILFRTKTTKM